jgi:hypothetical protein
VTELELVANRGVAVTGLSACATPLMFPILVADREANPMISLAFWHQQHYLVWPADATQLTPICYKLFIR